MKTSELDYHLPQELIAQRPADKRDASRLLVLHREETRRLEETTFANIVGYLRSGDHLVLNDTRVIRARLHGRKETGGHVELFLLRHDADGAWEALVRPGRRVPPGTTVQLAGGVVAHVEDVLDGGRRRVRFDVADVIRRLEGIGEIPLPPYIARENADATDVERYQTVFARTPGAVAAPTAGLHFTDELLDQLRALGVQTSTLTLHVGYGTFKPVQVETLEAHHVEPEEYRFPEATAGLLNATRAAGGRVVAVGTTATRVLETQWRDGGFVAGEGVTEKYIYPPYTFRGVDALITNFHLPRSSLLALVCAFAGTERVLDAYRYAIERRFRFYSYGDAMLIV